MTKCIDSLIADFNQQLEEGIIDLYRIMSNRMGSRIDGIYDEKNAQDLFYDDEIYTLKRTLDMCLKAFDNEIISYEKANQIASFSKLQYLLDIIRKAYKDARNGGKIYLVNNNSRFSEIDIIINIYRVLVFLHSGKKVDCSNGFHFYDRLLDGVSENVIKNATVVNLPTKMPVCGSVNPSSNDESLIEESTQSEISEISEIDNSELNTQTI